MDMSAKIRIATDKFVAGETHDVTICVIAPKGVFLLLKQPLEPFCPYLRLRAGHLAR